VLYDTNSGQPQPDMETLGQRLRAEREKRGLTIDQLAAELRINARYFYAIEADETSKLPGGFFYRSFVRQYARHLELPESTYTYDIERSLEVENQEFDARAAELAAKHIEVPPMPTGRINTAEETRRWLIRLGLLVVVLILASGAYVLYQRWRAPEPPPQAPAQQTIQKQAQAEPPAQPQTPAAEPDAGSIPEQPPATQPLELQPAATTVPAETAPAPPAQPPPPAIPDPSKPVRLVITSTHDTWMQVTVDGRTMFIDVLKPGESRAFSATGLIRVRLGNAGGVGMVYNGKQQPSAGPIGQIRTVEFTPDEARVIAPPPKPPASEPPQGAMNPEQ